MQLFTIPIYPHKIKSSATPHLHNQISTARQRTPESLSHVHEQPVFMGCFHSAHRQQLQRSALPSAERHQQTQPLTLTFFLPPYTARSAAARFFAPALPFPIRRMQTIEKRRYLGCVFASLCTRCAFLLSESESAWRTGTTASGAKQHGADRPV